MPSTFFGLNTAYLGLTAANASLNTTSNNIANVETEGYSRQYTVQQATDALRTFTTYGCAGAGVDVLAIERYRDEFYDIKYWENNGSLGQYEVKQYYMKQIENYFMDDGDEEGKLKGFSTIFDNMYDALAEVKKQSGSDETRRDFLGKAEELASYFNTMAGNLQKMQKDINAEIKVNVNQINSIAQKIVTLNKEINVIEIGGGNANELRDQRALLVDELSKIVDVETEELPVEDPKNPGRYTGATRFIVRIAGRQNLVDDRFYNTLSCVSRTSYEKVNQSDADGLYDIYWDNGTRFSLKNASMGGKLKGLSDLRDGNNGEYFHGKVSSTGTKSIWQKDEDGKDVLVKHSTVTVDVDLAYLQDINKCTLSDTGGKIMLGSKEYYYDSWTMNYDADNGTYSYEFILSDKSKNEDTSTMGLIGKDAEVGSRIDYQGIPYYMEQMNEWIRCYSKTFNDIMTQDGSVDNYGNKGQRLFLGDMPTEAEQFQFEDWGEGCYNKSFSLSCTDDSYYRLTAFNFAVSDSMIKDPNLMATHTGNSDEVSDYDIVDDLVDLKTNVERMKFRGSSANQFLDCILSDIALNAKRANDFTDNYTYISKTIQTQRLSISGVDEDEEAISLVKYQNAYTLASKMIQTLTEVYDRLILETGV